MNKIVKKLGLLVLCALCASVIAGCGAKEGCSDSTAQNPPAVDTGGDVNGDNQEEEAPEIPGGEDNSQETEDEIPGGEEDSQDKEDELPRVPYKKIARETKI